MGEAARWGTYTLVITQGIGVPFQRVWSSKPWLAFRNQHQLPVQISPGLAGTALPCAVTGSGNGQRTDGYQAAVMVLKAPVKTTFQTDIQCSQAL